MKCLSILILAASVLSSCHSTLNNNNISDTDSTLKDTAWTSLFNGKDTRGWHTYGKTEAGKAWKAENGVLHLDASQKGEWQTKNGGDLLTEKEYKDYEFSVEWKISRGGNSGIIFNIHEDPKKYQYCWYTGVETQIADNKENEDGRLLKHRAGDLYDLISMSKDVVKPAGEWNKTVIIINGGNLNIFVNDEQVITTKLGDDNWNKLVAGSKFKEWPDFGTFEKGHIALQDHGADVWFRDIKVREL